MTVERVEPKIKNYLKEHGISQTFIAQQINMTRPKLSCTLNEKREMTLEEYWRICKTLGVSVSTFFEV